jgi:heat shock protein HslJ
MKMIRLIALWCIAVLAVMGVSAQEATPEATETPVLPGSSWLLTATIGQDHQTLVLPGSSITLNFDEENLISGNGGCNGYGGGYKLGDEGEITFSELISTLMACADNHLTTQESIYLGALGGVTHYQLTEQQLTLRVGDVEALHFVRIDQDPLAGTSWELINEVPADVEATPEVDDTTQPITLMFDAAGQAGGNGGCNSYSTTYALKDTSITFSAVASTKMACEAGDIMQREQNFFNALAGATQYGLTDEHLYIRYTDGNRLAFKKVEFLALVASPLSGAPGAEVELTGSGFAPNSEIVIGFGPFEDDVYEPIDEIVSDGNGVFTIIVIVPTTADPAVDYVFMAAVSGTARTLSDLFDVTDS